MQYSMKLMKNANLSSKNIINSASYRRSQIIFKNVIYC